MLLCPACENFLCLLPFSPVRVNPSDQFALFFECPGMTRTFKGQKFSEFLGDLFSSLCRECKFQSADIMDACI
jgi:hypothetical protein